MEDILAVLRDFRLLRSEIVVGGGNRSLISRRINGAFYARGWQEKDFATSITVDAHTFERPTHAVDWLKGGVALEVEWNNKGRSSTVTSTFSSYCSTWGPSKSG